MDETREGNNKGKGPAIDCDPVRATVFFTECLLVLHSYHEYVPVYLICACLTVMDVGRCNIKKNNEKT